MSSRRCRRWFFQKKLCLREKRYNRTDDATTAMLAITSAQHGKFVGLKRISNDAVGCTGAKLTFCNSDTLIKKTGLPCEAVQKRHEGPYNNNELLSTSSPEARFLCSKTEIRFMPNRKRPSPRMSLSRPDFLFVMPWHLQSLKKKQ